VLRTRHRRLLSRLSKYHDFHLKLETITDVTGRSDATFRLTN
jgi:hypothetical protein